MCNNLQLPIKVIILLLAISRFKEMNRINFEELWNFKIFSVENRDIFVSNISVALVFLIVGIFLYRKVISGAFKYLIQKKFKSNESDLYLLQKVIGYMLFLIYICFVLNIANIPFTAFAFLGGAVALSIGLGAQSLVSDFLNGFLVILDKSVTVGNIVKIDNVIGKIESIGIRYTKIRTSENTEFIIPNNSIINTRMTKFPSDKTLLKAKIYLKIENKNLKIEDIEEKIIEALNTIPELSEKLPPELYFIEISQKTYKYQLNYYPKDFGKYNREYIQNLVNHKLIELLPNIEIKLPQ